MKIDEVDNIFMFESPETIFFIFFLTRNSDQMVIEKTHPTLEKLRKTHLSKSNSDLTLASPFGIFLKRRFLIILTAARS